VQPVHRGARFDDLQRVVSVAVTLTGGALRELYRFGARACGISHSVDARRLSDPGEDVHVGQYNFVTGTTSNISRFSAVVSQYARGRRFECYVDPADPTQAVISRDLALGYFIGTVFFRVLRGDSGRVDDRVSGLHAPDRRDAGRWADDGRLCAWTARRQAGHVADR